MRVLADPLRVVDTAPCGRFTNYSLRPEVIDALGGSFAELAATARATAAAGRKRSCP